MNAPIVLFDKQWMDFYMDGLVVTMQVKQQGMKYGRRQTWRHATAQNHNESRSNTLPEVNSKQVTLPVFNVGFLCSCGISENPET